MTTEARPAGDRLWTVNEVAAYLSMSKQWVYKSAELGTLPCVRLGAALRFRPADIHRYVDQHSKGVRVLAFRPG